MAATATAPLPTTALCIICQTLTNEKPKPGILPCLGCQQLFCYQHIGQHRQDLADQLDDTVVTERNNLFEIISKLEENCDQYTVQQMKEIDDWELKSYETIKQVAIDARRKLHEMALNECDNLRARFALLSTELSEKREMDNYFEKDIELLKHKFHQLKHDTENFRLVVAANNELQTMELIDIKRKPSSSISFIDHLLLTQKPVKYINTRNSGTLYAINENLLAFEHNGLRDIDLYNTIDGSMRTLSRPGGNSFNVCYSTYLQSFLYLIESRRRWHDLYQWSIMQNNEPKMVDLKHSERISTITCYGTNLMVVFHTNTVEKWSLNGLKLDSRWRTPITCEHNESIKVIGMNAQYYGLVIKKVDGDCFELRNNVMSIIGSVKITYDYFLDLINLPNNSGWLFCNLYHVKNGSFVIDNELNIHEQKFIYSSNVQNIVVQGETVFVRYTEQTDNVPKTQKCPIECYRWNIV